MRDKQGRRAKKQLRKKLDSGELKYSRKGERGGRKKINWKNVK